MPVLLTDPETEMRMIPERESTDAHKWDEVWDGVLVMPTLQNDEHQDINRGGNVRSQGRQGAGPKRPLIQLIHTGTGQVWTA
jgi:hypothetical protein